MTGDYYIICCNKKSGICKYGMICNKIFSINWNAARHASLGKIIEFAHKLHTYLVTGISSNAFEKADVKFLTVDVIDILFVLLHASFPFYIR